MHCFSFSLETKKAAGKLPNVLFHVEQARIIKFLGIFFVSLSLPVYSSK